MKKIYLISILGDITDLNELMLNCSTFSGKKKFNKRFIELKIKFKYFGKSLRLNIYSSFISISIQNL